MFININWSVTSYICIYTHIYHFLICKCKFVHSNCIANNGNRNVLLLLTMCSVFHHYNFPLILWCRSSVNYTCWSIISWWKQASISQKCMGQGSHFMFCWDRFTFMNGVKNKMMKIKLENLLSQSTSVTTQIFSYFCKFLTSLCYIFQNYNYDFFSFKLNLLST